MLDTFAAQVASICTPVPSGKVMMIFVGSYIVENALIVETAAMC